MPWHQQPIPMDLWVVKWWWQPRSKICRLKKECIPWEAPPRFQSPPGWDFHLKQTKSQPKPSGFHWNVGGASHPTASLPFYRCFSGNGRLMGNVAQQIGSTTCWDVRAVRRTLVDIASCGKDSLEFRRLSRLRVSTFLAWKSIFHRRHDWIKHDGTCRSLSLWAMRNDSVILADKGNWMQLY